MSGEDGLRWWKLSCIEVLFKVDGVGVWVVGEVVDGVIGHEVKVPSSTPIITATATVEVDQVFFSGSLES